MTGQWIAEIVEHQYPDAWLLASITELTFVSVGWVLKTGLTAVVTLRVVEALIANHAAVMVTDPGLRKVAVPPRPIDATVESEELHFTNLVTSRLPNVAANCKMVTQLLRIGRRHGQLSESASSGGTEWSQRSHYEETKDGRNVTFASHS